MNQSKFTPDELKAKAETGNADLANASAEDVVRWAVENFPGRVVVTQSMAHTVLAHITSRVAPEVDVVFLDTGFHFPETLNTADRLQATTKLNILRVKPKQTVAEQAEQYGPDLWKTQPDLCCQLRKVDPMAEILPKYDAWISGLRIATAPQRKEFKLVSFDEKRHVLRIAPLLHWSEEELTQYTLDHNVIVNPLVYYGYPSIGCAPCTRAVEPGEDPRAGRWAGLLKTECGLHL